MGISKLNDIQNQSVHSRYNPKTFKANTIIIDGNNLIFNRLTAVRATFANNHMNIDLGTIDKPLLYQLITIINSTIKGIVNMITNYYYNATKDEKNIIIVFDPPNTPNYYIPGVGIMNLKRKEEENRINKQQTQYDKIRSKIDDLKTKYSDEIESIYNQLSYLMNDGNIKKLIPIVKNELLHIYRKNISEEFHPDFNFPQEKIDICNHVYFIQSISEADLVIYNLAKLLNYAPVLIRSMDSDYYVLCSDLKNVYKRDISDKTKNKTTGKYEDTIIYSTWKIWREIFGSNITYDDIIIMATMAGNDYTAKASLYGFKVDNYKRLYAGDFSKITRSAKHLYPYIAEGYTNIADIMEKYCVDNEDARNSMLIYKHIDDNFSFEEMQLTPFNLNDLIVKIQNELNNSFYDYSSDITDISIVDDPCDYVHKIIDNIKAIENAEMMIEMNINCVNVNFGDSKVDVNIDYGNVNPNINVNSKINPNVNVNVNPKINEKYQQIDYSQVIFV